MLENILSYETILYGCCIIFVVKNIFNIDFAGKKNILLSLILGIPLILFCFFVDDFIFRVVYIISQLVIILAIKVLFGKIKLGRIISIYIVLYSINIIIIIFCFLIVSSFTDNYEWIDPLVNTVTAVLCVFICRSQFKHTIRQIVEWIPKSIKIITLFLLVIEALVSSVIFESSYFEYQHIWDVFSKVLLGLFLLAICLVLPFLILNSISNKQLKRLTENYERQIKAQAEHYKNLAKSNYELRRFKHDFKNISIAIEKMLADGQNLQVLKMVKDCNDSLDGHGNPLLKFDTGNGIADALLTEKQMRADEVNAEIAFDGAITQDYLSPTDLCVILGNTLDNAIEACENLPIENRKTITVVSNCNSGFMFLSISNPIHEKVKINKNHISTTKENKTLHGFGLYSLNSVVKNYDGSVELNSTDDNFTINIDLCLVGTQKTIA